MNGGGVTNHFFFEPGLDLFFLVVVVAIVSFQRPTAVPICQRLPVPTASFFYFTAQLLTPRPSEVEWTIPFY